MRASGRMAPLSVLKSLITNSCRSSGAGAGEGAGCGSAEATNVRSARMVFIGAKSSHNVAMRFGAGRAHLLWAALAATSLVPTLVAGQGARCDDHRAFEGIWNSATVTPLERPRQFEDKAFFT